MQSYFKREFIIFFDLTCWAYLYKQFYSVQQIWMIGFLVD